jgi:hypothetical protein
LEENGLWMPSFERPNDRTRCADAWLLLNAARLEYPWATGTGNVADDELLLYATGQAMLSMVKDLVAIL